MDELFLAITFYFVNDRGHYRRRENDHNSHEQDQRQQNVSALILLSARTVSAETHDDYFELLALAQRDVLPVVVQHILNLDGRRADMHYAIAPVHNVAFRGNEDVFAL